MAEKLSEVIQELQDELEERGDVFVDVPEPGFYFYAKDFDPRPVD